MARYAEKTKVPVDRTRSEIEQVLLRYGATGFAYAYDTISGKSQVEFAAYDRRIRFILPMPERDSMSAMKFEQAQRQRWRALLLSIKAKLEAVECGISTFEIEFLANIVDPMTKRTVGEVMLPQLEKSYSGNPSALLLTHEV